MIVSTAADGFNILMPSNIQSTLPQDAVWENPVNFVLPGLLKDMFPFFQQSLYRRRRSYKWLNLQYKVYFILFSDFCFFGVSPWIMGTHPKFLTTFCVPLSLPGVGILLMKYYEISIWNGSYQNVNLGQNYKANCNELLKAIWNSHISNAPQVVSSSKKFFTVYWCTLR